MRRQRCPIILGLASSFCLNNNSDTILKKVEDHSTNNSWFCFSKEYTNKYSLKDKNIEK